MKLIAGKIEPFLDIASGNTVQRVPYQIVEEDGTVLYEVAQTVPLEATAEEITELLQRAFQVYKDDSARHEAGKELQAGLNNASQVGEAISGLEIK